MTHHNIRRIAIATTTRADWGLFYPVALKLKQRNDVSLSIIAANIHLDPERGMTVNEIVADGFDVAHCIEMLPADSSASALTASLARCLDSLSRIFANDRPDMLLLLGDRYEMLAFASAATLFAIPIAHISGGELTEGAIDDNIRHALTKLSALHFPTTEQHRQRIIAMGEQPDRVVNAGALGVYNIANTPLMSREKLEESLNFKFADTNILATFHPATNDPADPCQRFNAMLQALDRFAQAHIILTYPNNDPRSQGLIEMIEDYARANRGRVVAIHSLGRTRYLSALSVVDAVVGNSSSGIVEVPSAGIPTVDIGIRQQGRTAADSVIHCGDSADDIAGAIAQALSPTCKTLAASVVNPYSHADTPDIIANTVATVDLSTLLPKKFYDITPLT
jgi:UDP-N-acetylglucosamine 2-epimerase (non-hydrolysing)/GDP/UDP-N,N'-diacetylbacillosamine 2-epimerase (hydrolysing)